MKETEVVPNLSDMSPKKVAAMTEGHGSKKTNESHSFLLIRHEEGRRQLRE
jgi:hypothetical protein